MYLSSAENTVCEEEGRRLDFGPLAFQHARILAGGVNLKVESQRGDIRERGFGLADGEQLIGVAIEAADKIVGQTGALRPPSQHRRQAQSAAEDRFVVPHAPLLQG